MIQATVTLIGGMQFAVETGSKHTLVIDSGNSETGGRSTGARPMELLVSGIAGCTAMDVISILRKMQQKITGLQVKISGNDADDHPKKLLEINLEYIISGFDVDEKKVQRAIQLSEERYCPAMATVRPSTKITNSYVIHSEPCKSL